MYRTLITAAAPPLSGRHDPTVTSPPPRGWIRRSHRTLSMVFTATVIANFVALGLGCGAQPPAWITYAPLLPLLVLMLSGLCLLVQPWLHARRTRT